jgi:hypothetical protein
MHKPFAEIESIKSSSLDLRCLGPGGCLPWSQFTSLQFFDVVGRHYFTEVVMYQWIRICGM